MIKLIEYFIIGCNYRLLQYNMIYSLEKKKNIKKYIFLKTFIIMGKVSVCHYKHRLVYTSCLNQIFLEKDEKYGVILCLCIAGLVYLSSNY